MSDGEKKQLKLIIKFYTLFKIIKRIFSVWKNTATGRFAPLRFACCNDNTLNKEKRRKRGKRKKTEKLQVGVEMPI